MSNSKVKNGSNKFGLTPGMTKQKNFVYTQGVNDTWHDELIHTSKKKIAKINNFLDEYEGGIREIEPEVYYFFINLENSRTRKTDIGRYHSRTRSRPLCM